MTLKQEQQQQQLLPVQDLQQRELLLQEGKRIAESIIMKAKSISSNKTAPEIEALLLQHNAAVQQQQQTGCFFATAQDAMKLFDAAACLFAEESNLLEVRFRV